MAAGAARHEVARALGATAGWASRLTGRGGGTTIGGRVTLAVDPSALARAATGRRIALVTGTNGKSTTRTLLVAALSRLGGGVVSNSGGANLPSGLTAALVGDRSARLGVLEVDEPYLPRVLPQVTPEAVVLLNLSRDQLDRYAEVRRLAAIWRSAVAGGGPTGGRPGTVVANADDPLVAWAASAAPAVRWVGAGLDWRHDAVACPACGGVIQFGDGGDGGDGGGGGDGAGWACGGCALRRPRPAWTLDGELLRPPDGPAVPLRLALPGTVNRSNAAMAAAAAAGFGVPPAEAVAAMGSVTAVEGRYLETGFRGRRVRLLLAKNPAGWQAALRLVRPAPAGLVVAVNARPADGRDPAWIWDVEFESLAGRRVVASGERARDVAVRLRYAGVDHQRVDDPARALEAAGVAGAQVEAVANYTAFQRLRAVLERHG